MKNICIITSVLLLASCTPSPTETVTKSDMEALPQSVDNSMIDLGLATDIIKTCHSFIRDEDGAAQIVRKQNAQTLAAGVSLQNLDLHMQGSYFTEGEMSRINEVNDRYNILVENGFNNANLCKMAEIEDRNNTQIGKAIKRK